MLGWCAYRDSPVLDEVPHLVSGLSHWKAGDFALYRSNPPLVRMVAALPVLFAGPNYDWTRYSDGVTRSEFEVGWDFTQANGERTFWLFTIARWACIPFSMLGGSICYRWANELFGLKSAFYALFLWCFSPYILTNGYLILPDMGATALGVTFFYFFWKWLKKPEWVKAILCGILLGLTQLTKMTWLILYPAIPILWLLFRLGNKSQPTRRIWRKEILQLCFLLVFSVFVLNANYGFDGSFIPLGEYEFQSKALTGTEILRGTGNRFRETIFSRIPVPFPEKYVTGIDVNKSIFEAKYPSYLRGELKNGGWWYYYLYGMAVKMPEGILMIIGISTLTGWFSAMRFGFRRDVLLLLFPLFLILIFVSANTGINRHTRYMLPIFPFLFISVSHLARYFGFRHKLVTSLILLAAGWQVWSVMSCYPYQSSYFNEISGGSENGYKRLILSNIGWGQNVLSLKRWLDIHPDVSDLHCAIYCQFDPKIAGIEYQLSPNKPTPGWHAVSAHLLSGGPGRVVNGEGSMTYTRANEYKFFENFSSVAIIGYDIHIYHLNIDEVNRLRNKLRLPLLKHSEP